MRAALLALLLLSAATAAAARPPALLWRAPGVPGAGRFAALVVERDADGVRLASGRSVEGACKLKPRAPSAGGLLFVLRDATGAPLLLGQSFDGELEIHGDEPDPVTGTLRSLSGPLDRTAFPLRVPLLEGARDVAVLAVAGEARPVAEILASVRAGDASVTMLGVLKVPEP